MAGGQAELGRLRRTRQREAVLAALAGAGDFVSARELHQRLSAGGVAVGLATIYRSLHDLAQLGRLDVVREESGERRYRQRPTDGHRHYVICRRCGRSEAIEAEAVERWAARLTRTTGFREVEHTLELTGVCAGCGPSDPSGRGTPTRDPHKETR